MSKGADKMTISHDSMCPSQYTYGVCECVLISRVRQDTIATAIQRVEALGEVPGGDYSEATQDALFALRELGGSYE